MKLLSNAAEWTFDLIVIKPLTALIWWWVNHDPRKRNERIATLLYIWIVLILGGARRRSK